MNGEMSIRQLRPVILMTALLLIVSACAAAGTGSDGTRRDSSVITAQELADTGTSNLYDAVNRLRPRWLTARSARTLDMGAGGVFVFQNNRTPLGTIDALRQMDTSSAYALRYLDAAQAQATLPGLRNQHVEGAIIIYTTEAEFNR